MATRWKAAMHRGLDDVLVEASRLRPMHPVRLSTGPIRGDPSQAVGGIPTASQMEIPLLGRKVHTVVPSPVRGVSPPNDLLPLHIYPAVGKPRAVVLFSPFWQIPGPWALQQYVTMVQRMGMHAVVYTPPDHMGRTPKGFFSGERVLSWDFPYMEDMLQLVTAELVALVTSLTHHGLPVHLVGLSLGGLYAALAAVCGAPVDSLALITPAIDVQNTMTETALGRRYQRMLIGRGDAVPDGDFMTTAGAPYRPGSYPRPLPASKIFMAQGAHDTVVPGHLTDQLGAQWGVPVHTYGAGHMSLIFLAPQVRRDWRAFLERNQPAGLKRHRQGRRGALTRATGRVARVLSRLKGRIAP